MVRVVGLEGTYFDRNGENDGEVRVEVMSGVFCLREVVEVVLEEDVVGWFRVV